MVTSLMVRVCVCLTLAQLNRAGSQRDAQGRLASLVQHSDVNGQLEAGPRDRARADRRAPAPVWRSLQGRGKSPGLPGSNQPQFRCSNNTLTLRFSPTRYTNLHLEDGTPLLLLPDRCHGSLHIYRWYLLVKLPNTGCYSTTQIEEGGYSPLKLHYFDQLLQKNMMGMAVCENPEMSPLVTCGTSITVKLPPETKLKEVKELDDFVYGGYSVSQWKTRNALFVQISKLPDKDSGFELVYLDSTGKLQTKLVICYQKQLTHRVTRALEEPDIFELWDFEETPVEPYDPDKTSTKIQSIQDTTTEMLNSETTVPEDDCMTTQAPNSETTVPEDDCMTTQAPNSETTLPEDDCMTTQAPNSETVTEDDSTGLFELWGIEDIPEEPYIDIDGITVTTTPAPSITTTNSTKTTVAVSTISCL
ncbi:uncharacterized protein LOC117952992 [Etheostoma cragini]|uniref:uncharacterized protein LOC117952992 n=1 Tax=Etheostoma cragini TaxID=417921 RepID=UPI00155E401D|nr:uncharacterized protein LOC117952992 [Etheostoma cragini]